MSYPARPLAERFWEKVDKTDSCWLWTAATASGYGRFMLVKGVIVQAHTMAYELEVGPVPDGLILDHLCRVKLCVNPLHLEPVTQRENILRGTALSALRARQTHCLRGHAFDEANTHVDSRNRRNCRACGRQRKRDEWARKQGLMQ